MFMSKRSLMVMVIAGVCSLFIASAVYAGTAIDPMIKMENKKYAKHKKSIVDFSHKKHSETYGIGCGECHHDATGKPLGDLKLEDNVQNCIDCHKKPGRKPRAKKGAPKLTQAQKLEYHAEAIHLNCISCHKKSNKKSGTKAAPTSCTKCHPKK